MEDYLAKALEIARAQASVRMMSAEEITEFATALSKSLREMSGEGGASDVESAKPFCNPKSSIRDKSITCLVCGKKGKMLTKAHLATHGLTPAQYKAKFGLKADVNLVCKSTLKDQRARMVVIQAAKRAKA
jgi:predicted transcriptional regulator